MDTFLGYIDRTSKFILNIGLGILLAGILTLCFFFKSVLGQLIGTLFVNLGLTVIVVDYFIADLNIKIFQKTLGKQFRSILGIENINSRLLPDIMGLIRGSGYVVLSSKETDIFYYEDNHNQRCNMGLIEKVFVKIIAKEDNVHYFFKRSSSTGDINKMEILKLMINKEGVSPYDQDEFTIRKSPDCNYYFFERPLEKGKEYDIYFELKTPRIMSDLNYTGKEAYKEDYIMSFYIQLTNKSTLALQFPKDFKMDDYEFRVRREDISKLTYLPVSIKRDKSTIVISQENLDVGDKIWIFYRKR